MKKIYNIIIGFYDSLILIFLFFGVIFLIQFNLRWVDEQQFVYLAKSFLEGKTYFLDQPITWSDSSLSNGHYFWPLGPLPAILLTPFVFFGSYSMNQGYLQFILNLINLCLLYRISNKITGNKNVSLWLSFGFIFATSYFPVAAIGWSWMFAQVVATTLLLLAIDEYFSKKRWYLMGIYLGFLVLTRLNLILAAVFFALELLANKSNSNRLLKFTHLLSPLFIAIFILGSYNYLRFQNIFEQGYNLQILSSELSKANRNYGLWSFLHFPANLYYLFLKGFDPVFIPQTKILTFPFIKTDYWGLSIFFTSPMFLWLIYAPWKNIKVKHTLITALLILVSILGYYGIGATQVGYRYALDFYPFLFVAGAYSIKNHFSWTFKMAVILGFVINLYLLLT